MKDLKGKVAVITGAGSGIGRALALQLDKQGALLALNDKDKDGVTQTAEGLHGQSLVDVFDVSNREAMDAFAGKVQNQFGQVDLLFNNAGMTLPVLALEYIQEPDFRHILEVNLWGSIYGTLAFLPFIKTRPEAAIVNISSVLGLIAYPLQGPYTVSKFALRGFTEALRLELRESSILVCAVYPGGIKTDIVRHVEGMEANAHQELIKQFDEMAKTTPEEAALTIINGIKKEKTRILIGGDARNIDRVARLMPSSYEQLILRKGPNNQ